MSFSKRTTPDGRTEISVPGFPTVIRPSTKELEQEVARRKAVQLRKELCESMVDGVCDNVARYVFRKVETLFSRDADITALELNFSTDYKMLPERIKITNGADPDRPRDYHILRERAPDFALDHMRKDSHELVKEALSLGAADGKLAATATLWKHEDKFATAQLAFLLGIDVINGKKTGILTVECAVSERSHNSDMFFNSSANEWKFKNTFKFKPKFTAPKQEVTSFLRNQSQ